MPRRDDARVRPVTPADGAAWITGASSGIGRALALELARRGWTVLATARNAAELAGLTASSQRLRGRIHAYPADVTDEAGMAACVARMEAERGPIAMAVLNAGIYLPVDGHALSSEPFARSLAVNVMGTVHGLVPLIPRLLARGRGQIAIVSSVTGYGGLPTSAAYGATKAALNNMAESLWFDLVPRGVGVSVINPGFVKTPATDTNRFPMPFIIPAETAARRIARGLARGAFEITFPKRFTFALKAINRLLPRRAYLRLVAWATKARH